MRIFLGIALLALVVAPPAHATNTLIGGTWKDAAGVLINGSLTAQLAVTALDGSTSQTVTTRPVTFRLLNGAIQAGAYLVDTANMQPQNNYYVITVTDESGNTIMRGNYVVPAVAMGVTYPLAAAVPTVLTTSSVYYPQVNIFTGTPSTVNANFGLLGPTNGAAAIPTFRALVAADLPFPGPAALGGVQSKAAVANNFLTGISTAGVVTQARPTFANLSDVNAGVTCLNALTYNSGTTTFGCNVSAGTGTVTSVALTTPAIFSVAGSPIVASGTLAVTLVSQNANLVWAGPSGGGPVAPTFRSLVAADIPTLDISTKTSGNLAIGRLNSGNNASTSTFWRGDGVWTNIFNTPALISATAATSDNVGNIVISIAHDITLFWTGTGISVRVDSIDEGCIITTLLTGC